MRATPQDLPPPNYQLRITTAELHGRGTRNNHRPPIPLSQPRDFLFLQTRHLLVVWFLAMPEISLAWMAHSWLACLPDKMLSASSRQAV